MTTTMTDFELYLHPTQRHLSIKAIDLQKHLKETGLISRCLSVDDEVVEDWLAHPETYPREFRYKAVVLWGSIRPFSGDVFLLDTREWEEVAYLSWDSASTNDERPGVLRIYWSKFTTQMHNDSPALLRQSCQVKP